MPLGIVVVGSHSLSGKLQECSPSKSELTVSRGINEGRQAARDVDTYLMGVGTQLPKTGGIVQRAPYEIIGNPEKMKRQAMGAA